MSQGFLFGDTRTDEQRNKDRRKNHHCHAVNCKEHCKPELLMCPKHWAMVPKDLQRQVWEHYREGQCNFNPRPSREWFKAADAAIRAVAKNEGITFVVNLRKKPYDVYIGRKGKGHDGYFGNPFSVRQYGPEQAMARFIQYFEDRVERDSKFRNEVLKLQGKTLGCFCKPGPCHGDVIARWLNDRIN